MVKNSKPLGEVPRRQFLAWLWVAATVALFGQSTAAMLGFFRPRVQPGAFGGEVVAGVPEEFPPGTVSHVREGRFYISRLEDGGVLALWQRCTHLGCTVPWEAGESQFNCPCHSSFFNPRGVVTGGPAPRPLDLFPVSQRDGWLVVDTSQPIERQVFDPSQVFYPE